ncbi:MAG: cyclase [Chloroflexota bacterium]
MTTMFVRHTVADYASWRAGYDAFDAGRTALGVTAQAVWQAAGNPNDVTVTHDFATLEAAQAFANSPELHHAMEQAGVVGAPSIWFASRA